MQNAVSFDLADASKPVRLDGIGGHGGTVDAFAGYEWSIESLRASLELDLAFLAIETTLSGDFIGYRADGLVRPERTVTATVRAGWQLNEHSQLFILGGYATTGYVARIAVNYESIEESTSGEVQSIVLGLGLQTSLSDEWAIRGSFTHHRFEEFSETEDGFRWTLEPSISTTSLALVRMF